MINLLAESNNDRFLNVFYAEKEIPRYILTITDISKINKLNVLGKNFDNTKIIKPLKGPKKSFKICRRKF